MERRLKSERSRLRDKIRKYTKMYIVVGLNDTERMAYNPEEGALWLLNESLTCARLSPARVFARAMSHCARKRNNVSRLLCLPPFFRCLIFRSSKAAVKKMHHDEGRSLK